MVNKNIYIKTKNPIIFNNNETYQYFKKFIGRNRYISYDKNKKQVFLTIDNIIETNYDVISEQEFITHLNKKYDDI